MPNPQIKTELYKGEVRTLSEIAKMTGVKRHVLYQRLYVLGWTMEEATGEVPPRNRRSFVKYLTVQTPDGPVQMTMTKAAAYRGIKLPTLSKRLGERGWTEAQALEYEPPPTYQYEDEDTDQGEGGAGG